MPVSKPDYIGLEELSTRVSNDGAIKDSMIKYFIGLSAGLTNGNGALAEKLKIIPGRAENINSWLVYGHLIADDGSLTKYGASELIKLTGQKDHVANILEDFPDELGYFLGIVSQGNLMQNKESEIINPATIPERSEEPAAHSHLPEYIEKKAVSGDMLSADGAPSGSDLLESAYSPDSTKKVHNKMELYELKILHEISEGTKKNEILARNVGIDYGYVSYLLNQLKKCGCIEGKGKKRIITEKGIETLKSQKIDRSGIPAKIAKKGDEISVSSEPVITQEEIKTGSFETPKSAPAVSVEKIADIIKIDNPANNSGLEYPEITYDRADLLTLEFLMGVENGLKADELAELFKDEGGLYRIELQFRKEKKIFTKKLDVYTLDAGGSSKLNHLKEKYAQLIADCSGDVRKLHEKMLAPSIKPEPAKEILSATDIGTIVQEVTAEESAAPLLTYIADTDGDNLPNAGNEQDVSNLLEPVQKPCESKKTRHNMEDLEYGVLKKMYDGVLKNGIISLYVGISKDYVSGIVYRLRKKGYVEGTGKDRHISQIGVEKLKSYMTASTEMPDEVVRMNENAPEMNVSFRSESYRGIAKKNPRGTRELERIINRRGYGNKPAEGPYANHKKETEVDINESSGNDGISVEEISEGVPKEMVELEKTNNIFETFSLSEEDAEPKKCNEFESQALKFLLGIERGLKADDLSKLFENEGGLYLVESRLRKAKLFSKMHETYKLESAGLSKLAYLKQAYDTEVLEYLDTINYLRENKKMPSLNDSIDDVPDVSSEDFLVAPSTSLIIIEDQSNEIRQADNIPMVEQNLIKPAEIDVVKESSEHSVVKYRQTPFTRYEGTVRLVDDGVRLNVFYVNPDSPEPLTVQLSPEVVLLELVKRTKSTKKDLFRYVETQKDWMYYRYILEASRGLVLEDNGILKLTKTGREFLDEIECRIHSDNFDVFENGNESGDDFGEDEVQIIYDTAFIDDLGEIELTKTYPYLISKLDEYQNMPKTLEVDDVRAYSRNGVDIESNPISHKTPTKKELAMAASITEVTKRSIDKKFNPESIGIYQVGKKRWVILTKEGVQRTILSNGKPQKYGLDYYAILSGNMHGKEFDQEAYEILKSLDLITGTNGNTAKTEKGAIAEIALKELLFPSEADA